MLPIAYTYILRMFAAYSNIAIPEYLEPRTKNLHMIEFVNLYCWEEKHTLLK